MWLIELTSAALNQLRAITDLSVRARVTARIDWLKEDPDTKGKALRGELAGFYSIRAAGLRYRIVYRLDRGAVIVTVVAVGRRKEGDRSDIYSLARRLLSARLIDPDR